MMEEKERVAGGEDAAPTPAEAGAEHGAVNRGAAGMPAASGEEASRETGGAGESSPGEPVDVEALRRQLAEQTARAEDYFQRLVRMQADFENYRKRVQREKEEYMKFAGEQVITALLPVLDNLELALAARDQDPARVAAGVEMIYRQLQDVLAREGLSPIKAVGEQFDPAFHEAVMQEENAAVRDNTVLEEFRRGYCFKERLIRPAMVKVARSAKKEQASETQEVEE